MSGAAASDLTGRACSPNGIHWTYDTYALGKVAGKPMVERGDDTWFFITVDYVFGHSLERDASAVINANGGKVIGSVRPPFATPDLSSFILQAQASKAKVIALANAGDNFNKIQAEWVEKLGKFVAAYPKADDTPDALLQAGRRPKASLPGYGSHPRTPTGRTR